MTQRRLALASLSVKYQWPERARVMLEISPLTATSAGFRALEQGADAGRQLGHGPGPGHGVLQPDRIAQYTPRPYNPADFGQGRECSAMAWLTVSERMPPRGPVCAARERATRGLRGVEQWPG